MIGGRTLQSHRGMECLRVVGRDEGAKQNRKGYDREKNRPGHAGGMANEITQ
jgi:hypothetical protein